MLGCRSGAHHRPCARPQKVVGVVRAADPVDDYHNPPGRQGSQKECWRAVHAQGEAPARMGGALLVSLHCLTWSNTGVSMARSRLPPSQASSHGSKRSKTSSTPPPSGERQSERVRRGLRWAVRWSRCALCRALCSAHTAPSKPWSLHSAWPCSCRPCRHLVTAVLHVRLHARSVACAVGVACRCAPAPPEASPPRRAPCASWSRNPARRTSSS